MSNKNIRIMQVVGILMVNNAFILLAVADIDFLNIALYGGWGLIVIAGIYLARATEEMVDDFNARYQEQQRRYK
jgi:dihydrodipicolinate synthase/N-acetylneuraminate lyase